jgi:gamma-glutamyltranspeptidase/glutathione hydrolase
MQPQGHAQFLINHLVFGMDPQEAIDANRFRHFSSRLVAIEGIPQSVRDGLAAMGHQLRPWRNESFGGAQAIVRLERGWAAGSDPRKDGMAAGH